MVGTVFKTRQTSSTAAWSSHGGTCSRGRPRHASRPSDSISAESVTGRATSRPGLLKRCHSRGIGPSVRAVSRRSPSGSGADRMADITDTRRVHRRPWLAEFQLAGGVQALAVALDVAPEAQHLRLAVLAGQIFHGEISNAVGRR